VYTLGSLERSHVPGSDPNAGKKKVIAGAVLGGVLGGVLGHDAKGTVLGAAAGAAAGAAVAQASKDYEDCLPASSPLQLTLSSALLIT
jgi:outer membrane lipoprotein SlyB